MLRHLGYMAAPQSIDACTSRVCRYREATPDRVRGLIRDNLRDLCRILRFNAECGIAFYRVCSQIIPFGSDPGNTIAWWDEFAGELERIGLFVRDHGLRLEMHPGHHTLLNAPSPETVALSILELGWHVRFLDAIHVDASHKLVIRIGGTFGDKADSLNRFVSVIQSLPGSWRRRLAIENDEGRYGVFDVIEAAERTGLPAVLSWSLHRPNPRHHLEDSRLVGRCLETWKPEDGPAIVHLGSPSGERGRAGNRSEWVEPSDLGSLLAVIPDDIPFDCLLEAEQGDRALFDLRERMTTREYGELPSRPGVTPSPIV